MKIKQKQNRRGAERSPEQGELNRSRFQGNGEGNGPAYARGPLKAEGCFREDEDDVVVMGARRRARDGRDREEPAHIKTRSEQRAPDSSAVSNVFIHSN